MPSVDSPELAQVRSFTQIPKSDSKRSKRPLVVLVPGLNAHPHSMDLLAQNLESSGYPSVVIPIEKRQEGESRNSLVDNLREGVEAFVDGEKDTEVVLFGFSLGALVAAEYVLQDNPSFVTKILLAAPAQGMRLRNFVIRPLTWLYWTGLGIRSFAPTTHRSRAFTPLRTYNALFELYSDHYQLNSKKLQERQGAVILVQDDELISTRRTLSWLERNLLTHWKVYELRTKEAGSLAPRHLIVHPDGIGEQAWKQLVDLVLRSIASQ